MSAMRYRCTWWWPAVLLGLLFVSGCQDSKVIEENRALAREVMVVHDRAMARMTEIQELRLAMKQHVPADEQSGSATEIVAAIAGLEQAHRGMMEWMHQYRNPQTDEDLAGARDYLQGEMHKIEVVDTAINDAITRARSLLSTL